MRDVRGVQSKVAPRVQIGHWSIECGDGVLRRAGGKIATGGRDRRLHGAAQLKITVIGRQGDVTAGLGREGSYRRAHRQTVGTADGDIVAGYESQGRRQNRAAGRELNIITCVDTQAGRAEIEASPVIKNVVSGVELHRTLALHGRHTDTTRARAVGVGQLPVEAARAGSIDNGDIGRIEQDGSTRALDTAHVNRPEQPQVLAADFCEAAVAGAVGGRADGAQTDGATGGEQTDIAPATSLGIGAEQAVGGQDGGLAGIEANGPAVAVSAIGADSAAIEQHSLGAVSQHLTVISRLEAARLDQGRVGHDLTQQTGHLTGLEQDGTALAPAPKLRVKSVGHHELHQTSSIHRESGLGSGSQVDLTGLGQNHALVVEQRRNQYHEATFGHADGALVGQSRQRQTVVLSQFVGAVEEILIAHLQGGGGKAAHIHHRVGAEKNAVGIE